MSVPSPPDLFDDDADDAALSSSADGIKRTWTVLLDGTSSYVWKDKYVQHAAAQGGNADELKALLTRGSNATVDDVDDDQWTCLCYAAWENHQECVRILLECNADPLKANPNGAVPLMLACGTGAAESVRLLLHSMDATAVRDTNDKDKKTAMDFLVDLQPDNEKIMSMLRQKIAEVR